MLQYDPWRGGSLQLPVFFRRGKLNLTLTAYSVHILDENTRSLLWPAFSLPYAESDALQFIFSNLKLNVAPGTSWLKS